MRLLLDTHVCLWMMSEPKRLSPGVLSAISDQRNQVFVSAASALEIAIKQSLEKIVLPGPAETWLPDALEQSGIKWISITPEDALRVRGLAWYHRDPFDRLLVAQAMGGYTLVTHDRRLEKYEIPILWT